MTTHPHVAHTSSRNAGIVSRGVAGIIDVAVVAMLLGGTYLGLALGAMILNPTGFRLLGLHVVFSTTASFAMAVLYLAGCWAVSGCTVGAVVMGLRVLGRRKDRVSPWVAVGRAVVCVLFPIGLAWVVVDRDRRSVQDRLFGTRVVYVRV